MSRDVVRWIGRGLVALACVATLTARHGQAGPSPGDPAKGKKIFVVKCIACHKVDGSGGFKVTGNPTPDWRDKKRMSDPAHNDGYLRDCITNGKMKSGMVAWAKQGIKPAEIENLIAYVRTFSGTKSAEPKRDSTAIAKSAGPDSSAKPDSAARDSTRKP